MENNLPPANPVVSSPASPEPTAPIPAATQPTVPPVPEPEVTPPPPPPPHKSKLPKFIIFVGILLTLLGVGTYFTWSYFQNELNKKEIPEPEVQKVITKGALIIGTDATYQPMEFLDESGNLIGYDIDLGNRIAEKLILKAEFKNIPWDDLFTALEKGEVDMIISGVTISDERKEKYDFSSPYLNAGQVIITQKENEAIKTVTDLSGKRIGVQKETTNEEEAKKYTSSDLVITYENFEDATKALVAGEVDAVFSDLTNAKGLLEENPSLRITGDPITSEEYGIVFRKGDELVVTINDQLDSLRQQGVLAYLKQKWLE